MEENERLGMVRLTEPDGGRPEVFLEGAEPREKQFPGPWSRCEGAGRMFDPSSYPAPTSIYLLVGQISQKIFRQRHRQKVEQQRQEEKRRQKQRLEKRQENLVDQLGGTLYNRASGNPAYLVEAHGPGGQDRILVSEEIFQWLQRDPYSERPSDEKDYWQETNMPGTVAKVWRKLSTDDELGIPVRLHHVFQARFQALVRVARHLNESLQSAREVQEHLQAMEGELVDEWALRVGPNR